MAAIRACVLATVHCHCQSIEAFVHAHRTAIPTKRQASMRSAGTVIADMNAYFHRLVIDCNARLVDVVLLLQKSMHRYQEEIK